MTKLQQTNKQFISPTKRESNQKESIKQSFDWNTMSSLRKPKRQSQPPSYVKSIGMDINGVYMNIIYVESINNDMIGMDMS